MLRAVNRQGEAQKTKDARGDRASAVARFVNRSEFGLVDARLPRNALDRSG